MAWQLRAYLLLASLLRPVAPAYLRRRLNRGREDPLRWQEKLGVPGQARPEGRLIWLHAVGIGEVMALRGLILAMSAQDPALSFLVTSTARSSGQVMAANLPPRTRHQFLPLDVPAYVERFLDHWRPDLAVWSEQDIWPAAVTLAARRGIQQALVNARMNADSFSRRKRLKGLFSAIYQRFALIFAQDMDTAAHLAQLGAKPPEISGSLKAAAPALTVHDAPLALARAATTGRKLWLAASTHPEDEALALCVQAGLFAADDRWLLILVPRDPTRRTEILDMTRQYALPTTIRSSGQAPGGAVYLADTFGELGLWYRLCPVSLVGGTFGPVEGHNPWEPAALGSAILHGPRVANFAADYATLAAENAALEVSVETLKDALMQDHADLAARARGAWLQAQDSLAPLAAELLALVQSR